MPKAEVAYLMRFQTGNIAAGKINFAGTRMFETGNGAHQ
jgi:hypothetical protein